MLSIIYNVLTNVKTPNFRFSFDLLIWKLHHESIKHVFDIHTTLKCSDCYWSLKCAMYSNFAYVNWIAHSTYSNSRKHVELPCHHPMITMSSCGIECWDHHNLSNLIRWMDVLLIKTPVFLKCMKAYKLL